MLENFKDRSLELERLDTGEYTAVEYSRWQREMWFIHRLFGELRALKRSLFREMEANTARSISVIDVGAGSGELLKQLARWTAGRDVRLIGAELSMDAARSINRAGLCAVQCNALRLPFDNDSFDYAFCSLVLHHLDDDSASSLIKEMSRVSIGRIFVIDLNRHPIAYYFFKALGRFFLQRFTLEDGALSILRSRTPGELRQVASSAGLSDVRIDRSRLNRLILSGLAAKDD
jgi:ubiquinone/menaquinone biosynthesis C-methylase UbiE